MRASIGTRVRSAVTVFAVIVVGACRAPSQPAYHGPAHAQMDRGRADAAAWIALARDGAPIDDGTLVALAYLERLRIGLGSPFRLAEYALRDARLDASLRHRLAWAILARAEARRDYAIEPAALDVISARYPWEGTGAYHLALIENSIEQARDPRAGELAVRVAYALAAAEGAVSRSAPAVAVQAAALVRDRELARQDVRRLLAAADHSGVDALELLPRWRAERRFQVEQALGEPLPFNAEGEAIALAPRLAEVIRTLPDGDPPPLRGSAPLLPRPLAARLLALSDGFGLPPEAPIVVSVRVHRSELLNGHGADLADSAAAARFVAGAQNEETFAAENALLWHYTHLRADIPARVALAAAVALRTYAQEPVWLPGDGGPTTADLEGRFGLASVRFDGSVPDELRPYYRRMLSMSLTDLQRVLPALDVRGLAVRIGSVPRRGGTTLAMHDPNARIVYFPPASGAGTIAHELAHDLDWQVASRRYRVRGDYATDRATRAGGGRLASSMQELAEGALEPVAAGQPTSHQNRPAEIFARNLDWLVSQTLASDGRMDGYLSSVQDGVLTGYGSVTPPDYTGKAGDAIVSILDDVAPLPAATRRWYLEHHGLGRPLAAYDLVRAVLEAPVPVEPDLVLVASAPLSPEDTVAPQQDESPSIALAGGRFAAVEAARDRAMSAIDDWVCSVPGAGYDRGLQESRRRLVRDAAQARADGVALHRAEELAGTAGRGWVAHQLFGDPWPAVPVDPSTTELLAGLVRRAREVGAGGPPLAEHGFVPAQPPARCAAGPLLGATNGEVAPLAPAWPAGE